MKRKHFLIALCVIAFTTGAFALNRKLHFVQKFVGVETGVQSYQQQNKPLSTSLKLSGKIDEFSRIQSKPIPEHIVYDQLFHAVVAFGKKA